MFTQTKVNSTVLSTTIASSIPKLSISVLLALCWLNPCFATLQKATDSGTANKRSAEIVGNPTVNKDRVTVRIKVKEADGRPALDLQEDNFRLIVDGKPINFKAKDWKSSKETTPPPAWIVFLLDYSGSMDLEKDSKGKRKLDGAIEAIRTFITSSAKRSGDTQVVVVPFGEGSGAQAHCNRPVTKTEIDRFFPAGDAKVDNQLEGLAKGKACASTNIYDPVTETVKFLTNPEDDRFIEREGEVKPRTSIILLSDGYQNKAGEEASFNRLITFLGKQDSVVIHTLGYGLTPEELGKKYGLNRAVKRSDIGKPVKDTEFVDRDRLRKIAEVTGGVAEFSPDAQAVSQKLDIFLDAILGEYEISYLEPNPERGSKHQVIAAVISGKNNTQSLPKDYNIGVFGRSLPLKNRLLMVFGVSLILLVGGILPFWLWGKQLKREALEG
jgi:von Willebrand factor type A domain